MQMGRVCRTCDGAVTEFTSKFAAPPVHMARRQKLAQLDQAHKTTWLRLGQALTSEDVHGVKPSGHGSVDDGQMGRPYWIARTISGILGYVQTGGRCCYGQFGCEVESDQYEVSIVCCSPAASMH